MKFGEKYYFEKILLHTFGQVLTATDKISFLEEKLTVRLVSIEVWDFLVLLYSLKSFAKVVKHIVVKIHYTRYILLFCLWRMKSVVKRDIVSKDSNLN